MIYEITGKIHSIGETKTFGESFTKREFVLFIPNEYNADYPDYRKIVLTKDRCSILDSYNVNDEIKVNLNLKGRLWTNSKGEVVCFNEDEAWRIEKVKGAKVEQKAEHPQADRNINDVPPENDPLPF